MHQAVAVELVACRLLVLPFLLERAETHTVVAAGGTLAAALVAQAVLIRAAVVAVAPYPTAWLQVLAAVAERVPI
jgi:hypothetical protein